MIKLIMSCLLILRSGAHNWRVGTKSIESRRTARLVAHASGRTHRTSHSFALLIRRKEMENVPLLPLKQGRLKLTASCNRLMIKASSAGLCTALATCSWSLFVQPGASAPVTDKRAC
jgi:hypothetical protein